jgi:hypothetical protein
MNRPPPGFLALAVLALLFFGACGGSGAARSAADAEDGDAALLPPVRAGSYQLSMSATCEARERTATGVLTLSPVSAAGSEAGKAEPLAVSAGSGEGTLLWGQTDLNFGKFASCFGPSSAPSGEPIHPSVLVEVLRWDGERHNQVLLVSTDASRQAGGGVAMWVERVEGGHIGGVWSRWEQMGRGEGRWEADLVTSR